MNFLIYGFTNTEVPVSSNYQLFSFVSGWTTATGGPSSTPTFKPILMIF